MQGAPNIILAIACATLAGPAVAQYASVDVSPDITLNLGGSVMADEDVGQDDLKGNLSPVSLGALPDNVDVTGFHRMANGDVLFSVDITTQLSGSVVARPYDVVHFDGIEYSLWLDGASIGLPAGVRFDAVSLDAAEDLVLSFDTTVSVDGITVADEDIVKFNGAEFVLLVDGSSVKMPGNVDIDALHFDIDSGHYFVSFDVAGSVDGLAFADEDLLRLNPVNNDWSMVYDGSSEHLDWLAGDLDAAFVTFLVGFILKDGFENF